VENSSLPLIVEFGVSLSLYHKLPQAVRPVENFSLPLIVEFGVSLSL
jgi:hypothetical protein